MKIAVTPSELGSSTLVDGGMIETHILYELDRISQESKVLFLQSRGQIVVFSNGYLEVMDIDDFRSRYKDRSFRTTQLKVTVEN